MSVSVRKRIRAGISTRARVLIHLRYRFILRGSAKPVLDYLINIAETPSPSSQNSIAFSFFLRSSFSRDKGRYHASTSSNTFVRAGIRRRMRQRRERLIGGSGFRDTAALITKFRGQTDPTPWENGATLSVNAELGFCESDRSVHEISRNLSCESDRSVCPRNFSWNAFHRFAVAGRWALEVLSFG
jgi:hypothetical protein